jgi:PST family polysaccharide transporter
MAAMEVVDAELAAAEAETETLGGSTGLTARTMGRAAAWSGLNSFVLRLSQFAIGVVVARLIDPKQFGVFAVAITVQTVIVNVSELGVSAALVRARDDVAQVARVVAFISIVSSALLAAAMFLTAPQLATLLGASAAADAVRILSLTVLIAGFSAVPYALLVREFRQDKRFLADACNFAVSSVSVILLAVGGFGANALASSRVLGQLATLVALYLIVKQRYWPSMDRKVMGSVLRYSVPLAAADMVAFALSNADYVVIGRSLGALPLGFYMLAFNISGWPVSVLGLVVNEVVLPAFAQVRDEKHTLPQRAAGALRLAGIAAIPISVMIFVLAKPLVLVVYGDRWAGAADTLALLGLFGSARILIGLLTNIMAALGHSRHVLSVQLLWIVLLIPALIVGVRSDGIRGAAIAQEIVGFLVVLPFSLVLVARSGGGSFFALTRSLAMPVLAGVVCGAAAYLVTVPLSGSGLQLVCGATVGLLVYVLVFGRWVRGLLRQASQQWG